MAKQKNESKLSEILESARKLNDAKKRPTFRDKLTPEQREDFDALSEYCKTPDHLPKIRVAEAFVEKFGIEHVTVETVAENL